jgi:hypothetical protein
MAEPPQQPPGTCSQCPAAIVIDDHVCLIAYTEPTKSCRKSIDVRQGMAATLGADGSRQILVQVGEYRARDVTITISAPTGTRVSKIKSTIDNPHVRIFETRVQFLCTYKIPADCHLCPLDLPILILYTAEPS